MYSITSSPNGGSDGHDIHIIEEHHSRPILPVQRGSIFMHRQLEQMRQHANSSSTRFFSYTRCWPLMEVPRMSFPQFPPLIVQHQQEGGGAQGAINREVYRIKTKSKTESKEDSKKKKKKQEKDNINGGSSDKEDEDDDNRCAVCLEQLQDGVVVGRLPCDHVFHEKCITPWLSSHHVCPVCRCNLLPNSSPSPSSLEHDGYPVSPPPPPPRPPRPFYLGRPHSHDQNARIHIELIHSPAPPPRGHHHAYPG